MFFLILLKSIGRFQIWKEAEIEKTLAISEIVDPTGVELIIKCRVHRRRV